MVAKINKTKCNGCGLCIYTCGKFALEFDAVKYKAYLAKPKDCVNCSFCALACPREAVTIVVPEAVRFLRLQREKEEQRIS